ncbi:MAG: hypothetical protein HOE44_13220, partial [Candidatus Marinimicrobia bacterium]|nr:hypothetical protein [Candidatus Neomarinimicrobiota bacterium]
MFNRSISAFILLFCYSFLVHAGTTHTVRGVIQNPDASTPVDVTISFNAYIQGRTGEVITASSSGAGYTDGSWYLNTGNFSTNWSSGEVLIVDFTNSANGGTAQSTTTLTTSGTDVAAQTTLTVVAGPAADVSGTSGNNQTAAVGAQLSNPFVVRVSDNNGNRVSGETVTFAVVSGGGSLSSTSVTTNSSGEATSTLTLGTATGANSVSATVGSLTAVTFDATGTVGDATDSQSTITSTVSTATVSSSATVTVMVKDAYGNARSGDTVTFALTQPTNGSTGSVTPSAVTDASGTATATLVLSELAGSNVVTATTGSVTETVTVTGTVTALA